MQNKYVIIKTPLPIVHDRIDGICLNDDRKRIGLKRFKLKVHRSDQMYDAIVILKIAKLSFRLQAGQVSSKKVIICRRVIDRQLVIGAFCVFKILGG